MIEVIVGAASLDDACAKATRITHLFGVLASFAANVTCQLPEVHLAYRKLPKDGRREFMEVFLPDETSIPREGSQIVSSEYVQLHEALQTAGEQKRIVLALNQYEVALRYWYIGGEWLSLAHLYMAIEALSPAIVRFECERLGIAAQELARQHEIDPDDPNRPRWREALSQWARATLIFNEDMDVYTAAKSASDGIEHGFMEFSDIHEKSRAATLSTFGYVRRTILLLLGMSTDSGLAMRQPLDVGSLRKIVRGDLLGDIDDPAAESELYPHLRWSSRMKAFSRDGDQYIITPEENFTVQCANGVEFAPSGMEVRGREQNGGYQPNSNSPAGTSVGTPPSSPLDGIWSIVERVTPALAIPGLEIAPHQRAVFNTYAVHVGIFEAITDLVRAHRPIEAMMAVVNGFEKTCRLQLMTAPDSGAGWAFRSRLDMLTAALSVDSNEYAAADVNAQIEALRQAADEEGTEIPSDPWPLDQTTYWSDNITDITFAQQVAHSDELAASLRTSSDGTLAAVHTTVENDELARCVLLLAKTSMLSSYEAAATVLDFPSIDLATLRADIDALT